MFLVSCHTCMVLLHQCRAFFFPSSKTGPIIVKKNQDFEYKLLQTGIFQHCQVFQISVSLDQDAACLERIPDSTRGLSVF